MREICNWICAICGIITAIYRNLARESHFCKNNTKELSWRAGQATIKWSNLVTPLTVAGNGMDLTQALVCQLKRHGNYVFQLFSSCLSKLTEHPSSFCSIWKYVRSAIMKYEYCTYIILNEIEWDCFLLSRRGCPIHFIIYLCQLLIMSMFNPNIFG